MKTKNKPGIPLPEWLEEHGITIGQLDRNKSDIDELLEDYTQLTEAIRYWTGKSPKKVEEFTYLAEEFKREITQKCSENR